MEKIVVFYDGETWETLSSDIVVMTITKEGLDSICDGERPENLEGKDIFSIVPITDFMTERERQISA